jgi:gliding motility-associated lipoprotein GldH
MRNAVAIVCMFLLVGCERSTTYERNHTISHHAWKKDKSIDFEVGIDDTTASYDLFINVRHSAGYATVNLWVNLDTKAPSGDTSSRRYNLLLGDNVAEQWLGDCVGDICDMRVPIASGLQFGERGPYRFSLTHLMWEEPLEGIMSVGLRLEKHP